MNKKNLRKLKAKATLGIIKEILEQGGVRRTTSAQRGNSITNQINRTQRQLSPREKARIINDLTPEKYSKAYQMALNMGVSIPQGCPANINDQDLRMDEQMMPSKGVMGRPGGDERFIGLLFQCAFFLGLFIAISQDQILPE